MTMGTDQFHLSRNDFHVAASETFKALIEDTDFADVTLVCDDDKQISAHKVILSANSMFFRKVLSRNHHQHPLIYLASIKFSDLQSLVRFMYLGEVNIQEKDLKSFLDASETLKIEGLSSYHKMFQSVSQASKEPEETVQMEADNVVTVEEALNEESDKSNVTTKQIPA